MGTRIVERSAWEDANVIFLVGPGGAGKSSTGQCLAPKLHRNLIDLDRIFAERIGPIDRYIRDTGYDGYKRANGMLARQLVDGITQPALFVTSSGFLSLDNPIDTLADNRSLLGQGYSIVLLPDEEIERASEILVRRQLGRGMSLDMAREMRKARERVGLYRSSGDVLVLSSDSPERIAQAIVKWRARSLASLNRRD